MSNFEQELVQNSRVFSEAFLPGGVTRLRSQALALVVGVSDKEEALEDLERARGIGRATNVIMEKEARECYLALTEADRSC